MPSFNNMDELEAAFRKVVAAIIEEWGSIDNILNNRQTTALMQTIVDTMTQLGMEVGDSLPQLIANEYANGSQQAIADLYALDGVTEGSLNTGFTQKIHVEAVQELVLDTGADLQAAIRTAALNGTVGIMDIVKGVSDSLATSLITGAARKTAQREVMKHLADNGLTSFVTSDGKRLPLDFYAQTVVRTKRKVANVTGQINRYKENGVNYVKILPHAPSCHICSAHFGVIVQISGEPTAGVPQMADTKLPPFHPNCKCSMVPIQTLEGEHIIQPSDTDNRTEAQRRAYEAEQRIRRKANEERKLYEKMKAEGIQVPATLGAFRRMKRKNDNAWKALQAEYRSTIQTNARQLSTQHSENR